MSRRGEARASFFLASLRAGRLIAWTLWCVARYGWAKAWSRGDPGRADMARRARLWSRGARRAMGLAVQVHGPAPAAGSLLVPNHLGYADVVVVGSVTDCAFITTEDVVSVPVLGWLLRLSGQIVTPRSRAAGLVETRRAVRRRLAEGVSVCVFLEGTSTGGDRVLPFKPALISSALDAGAPLVPVALHWRATRPELSVAEDLAYWKDHVLASHLWRLLGLSGFRVEVIFGEPLEPAGMDRKQAAQLLRERVVELLRGSGWSAGDRRS